MGGRDELEWVAHLGHELKWLTGELTGAPLLARQRGWTPRLDLMEAPDFFLIRVELAGVRPERLSLTYHQGSHSLSIRGERMDALEEHAKVVPHLLEIDYGYFAREVELPPATILLGEVKTQLNGGILSIVLPKANTERLAMTIEETITLNRL